MMAEGLRYKDKVTIVTGGSSGIGKGCATVFGKCNYSTFSHRYVWTGPYDAPPLFF